MNNYQKYISSGYELIYLDPDYLILSHPRFIVKGVVLGSLLSPTGAEWEILHEYKTEEETLDFIEAVTGY